MIALRAAVFSLGLIFATSVGAAPPAVVGTTPDETAVLAADTRQRDAVADTNLDAIAAISHRNLRVNAPSNRILTREELISRVRSGDIRNEVFERVAEIVIVTGDIGVVMGRETVSPGAESEQAKMYGQKTLKRRYTNIYLREEGNWQHIARHANVIPE